jgi:uncharacterized protein YbjT (DUF2867 family)
MKTLVIGGTGMVGSEVTRGLVDRGADVRVMTHTREHSAALLPGVEGIYGDMAEPDTLRPPLEGIDHLFFLVPVNPLETQMGLNVVQAAKDAGVSRIVYISVANAEIAAHIPHFGSKVPVENEIISSGIAYTILRPNNFFQNDFYFREAIMDHGIYPQPIGDVGLNRVDVRDIADAAVNALIESGHEGEIYSLDGPDSLTGNDVAAIYTRRLGQEVRYNGNDLDVWEEMVSKAMPDWLVYDYRIMYQYFQEKGMIPTPEELDKERRVIGHEPRNFDSFAVEVSSMWKEQKAAAA